MPPPPSLPSSSVGVGPEHGADEDRCRLLGTTGLIVQALMGVFVLLSLVVKRQLERRKRSWRIWMYDVSKQMAGQAVVHGLNVLISDVVASAAHNNPCSLYFLNVLIDTTIGVAIIYFSLKAYTWFFATYLGREGYVSGQYGRPPKPIYWWRQLAPYLMSIITMKLLVVLPLTLPGISHFLIDASHSLLDNLSPRGQVILVMAIFPVVMNILQFCLVDQVIKAGGKDEEEMEAGAAGDSGGRSGRADGAEYRRLPGWDEDHEYDGRGRDVEAGAQHRGSSRSLSKGLSASRSRSRSNTRTRKETPNGLATPVIPSSPLLSPTGASGIIRGYGSTTPSPIGSPVKYTLDGRLDINPKSRPDSRSGSTLTVVGDRSIWSKIMERINDGTSSGSGDGSSRDQSVVFDATAEANTRLHEDRGEARGGSRLNVRDGRGERSSAPSPESLYPSSFTSPKDEASSSSSSSPHTNTHTQSPSLIPSQDIIEEEEGLNEGSATPITSSTGPNSGPGTEAGSRPLSRIGKASGAGIGIRPDIITAVEGISRHPPEDMEREARWTLSPPESPVVRNGPGVGVGVVVGGSGVSATHRHGNEDGHATGSESPNSVGLRDVTWKER